MMSGEIKPETGGSSSHIPEPNSAPSSATPSTSSAVPTGPAPPKRRRNNTGTPTESCLTCRARKVKCAGRSPGGPCINCTRLDLGCSFSHTIADPAQSRGKVARTLPSQSLTEAGTARKRAQRACRQCHAQKTKCSGDLPACKRCAGAGLSCEYVPAKRKFAAVPHQSAAQQSAETADKEPEAEDASSRSNTAGGPATDRASSIDDSEAEQLIAGKSLLNSLIILEHLRVWFDLMHPVQSLGFFHPQTTLREAEERRFTSIIAAGICSITGLFTSPDDDGRKFTERCNLWVKFHISRTAGIFTKERLILLVLSSIYDFMSGDVPKVWEYAATASRIVTAMQYNWDATTGSFIEKESLRRLVWQVYILDRFLAGGYDEHLTLREEHLFLTLPCDDSAFRDNAPVQSVERINDRLLPASHKRAGTVCLLSIHLRLMRLRHHILGITKKYAVAPTEHPRAPHTEPSSVMGDIQRLQAQLSTIKEALPDGLQISEANIQKFYGTPEWSTYFMVHTWIFQLHLDLYRYSLPGLREQASSDLLRLLPPDFLAKCRCQAIAFAITQARFWETCQRTMAQHSQKPFGLLTGDPIYKMFFDLQAHSTVPPFRNEAVDDAVLAALVDSNMALLDQAQGFLLKSNDTARDIKEAVANFQSVADIDTPSKIGIPFVSPPEHVRLPGPHYMLENLHVMQHVDDESNRQRSASLADQFLGKRSAASSRSSQLSASVSPPVSHKQPLDPSNGPPDVPFYLAQARAGNTFVMTTVSEIPGGAEQQEEQSLDPFIANYDFDMTGALAQIPTFPLVSPETHMTIPMTGYDMNEPMQPQNMAQDVISPHEQFLLSQHQLGMYTANYGNMSSQEGSEGQIFNVPYREFG